MKLAGMMRPGVSWMRYPPWSLSEAMTAMPEEDNEKLAELAAVEVLRALETPISGYGPSALVFNHENARKIVKTALQAVARWNTNTTNLARTL